MKKLFCVCMLLAVLTSCKNEEQDMRVQLVNGVLELLESEGLSCDTTSSASYYTIKVSQKQLLSHYLPEIWKDYEKTYNEFIKANNLQGDEDNITFPIPIKIGVLLCDQMTNLTDSIESYISSFTSLEQNNGDAFGYLEMGWVYDNFECFVTIPPQEWWTEHGIFLEIRITKDDDDYRKKIDYETTSQDHCILILKTLYENYVLNDDPNAFEDVVDDMFTRKGKQKLIDAYADEYDGEIASGGAVGYALWELRTSAQDDNGRDVNVGLKEILPLGENKYVVKYYDMGIISEAIISFAEEDGKLKIDDYNSDSRNYELGR